MDDYLKMLKENVLTDFTIRVGEREMRAHRAILAARSPVFAAMFEHADTNEVKNVIEMILQMLANANDCLLRVCW